MREEERTMADEHKNNKAEKPAEVSLEGQRFVPLHLHSEYSLLDGAIRLKELPKRLKELGMKACALSDHGTMYGCVDFYRGMLAEGLKPLIACEVYVAPHGAENKNRPQDRERNHLLLIAETDAGLRNLYKIVSKAYTDGFYFKPRTDHAVLREHAEGLIATSACLGGEIPQALLHRDEQKAEDLCREYDEIFGHGNFFLEVQNHGIPEQQQVNSQLVKLARKLDLPLVATNDSHYLYAEDAEVQDILLCMQTGKHLADEDRMRMETPEFYLKSPEEMAALFPNLPEALENTVRIAERCNVEIPFDHLFLPVYEVPEEYESHLHYIRTLAEDGLRERLADGQSRLHGEAEYRERLDSELAVIERMGYVDYFLIVWDFIRYAKSRGIMVGPGRGSGPASLVAYALSITNIDPLQYSLLFERFLNPDRVSMPDFDIDFCYERRQEVIDYVESRYGRERVCQVVTFGTLAARACVRDVARVMDLSYAEGDAIAKQIPAALGMTLDKALEQNPELKKMYENSPSCKKVIDSARRLEGMPRHASTHAAGVIISSKDLTEIAPLARNDEAVVVQYTKENIERVGLLKFDFLGLRTMTVLRDTRDMVWKNRGISIDFERISLEEKEVYEMVASGETMGVFQLESPGMTAFIRELKPEKLEEIIAGVSLYRPGPMEQIPRYVKGKHHPETIHYDHPLLESILEVTYGCIVYQEQVMQIVRDLAGFSLGQADIVRRAMAKKKPAELARYEKLFLFGGEDEEGRRVPGALANGVDEATARKIFAEVMAFAGYAFNKPHAAAYALIAYQTAWLKYHYPVEYMASLLNSFLGNLTQAASYVRAAEEMGIEVLPPDINLSRGRFSTHEGKIVFALGAVKNVGAAIEALVEERDKGGPFRSFSDFLRRAYAAGLRAKAVESLIQSSALDRFPYERGQMQAAAKIYFKEFAGEKKGTELKDQISLFHLENQDEEKSFELRFKEEIPLTPPDSLAQKLADEKAVLGIYVSGHPLDPYRRQIESRPLYPSSSFWPSAEESDRELMNSSDDNLSVRDAEVSLDRQLVEKWNEARGKKLAVSRLRGEKPRDGMSVTMAGIVDQRRNRSTRNNKLMSILEMEDFDGRYEALLFPQVLERYSEFVREGSVLLLSGRLSVREDFPPALAVDQLRVLKKDEELSDAEKAALEKGELFQRTRDAGRGGESTSPPSFRTREEADREREKNEPYLGRNGAGIPGAAGDARRREPKERKISSLDLRAEPNFRPCLLLRLRRDLDARARAAVRATLRYFSGTSPVYIYCEETENVTRLRVSTGVSLDAESLALMAEHFGEDNVSLYFEEGEETTHM